MFAEDAIDDVLHFAGLKAVGHSVSQPLRYYDNNVRGSQMLLQACADAGVFNVVFISSDPIKAEKELGWKARRGLDEMMRAPKWI